MMIRRRIIFEDLPYRLNSLRRASDISLRWKNKSDNNANPDFQKQNVKNEFKPTRAAF